MFNIGGYSYISGPHIHLGSGDVTIGKFCSIGQNIRFITDSHHVDWISAYPFSHQRMTSDWQPVEGHPIKKDIKIGNDVWIGDSVIIANECKIGDGAIISAGSFITRNVKPYSVVGGNPAERLFLDLAKKI